MPALRWAALALVGGAVLGAGTYAAQVSGPVFRIYSQRDTLAVGDTERVYAMAIDKRGRRDLAPVVTWWSVDTSRTSLSTQSGPSVRVRVKRRGPAQVVGTWRTGGVTYIDTARFGVDLPAPPATQPPTTYAGCVTAAPDGVTAAPCTGAPAQTWRVVDSLGRPVPLPFDTAYGRARVLCVRDSLPATCDLRFR